MNNESDIPTRNDANALPADMGSWQDIALRSTPIGLMIMASDGKILFANHSAEVTYHAENSIVGRLLTEFLPPDVAAERGALVLQACDEGQLFEATGAIEGVVRRWLIIPIKSEKEETERRALVMCACAAVFPVPTGFDGKIKSVQLESNDWGPLSILTDREREILALIGEGLSTADIAKRLHRTTKTIEWHRAALGEKLNVTNRIQLARIAIHNGLANTQ